MSHWDNQSPFYRNEQLQTNNENYQRFIFPPENREFYPSTFDNIQKSVVPATSMYTRKRFNILISNARNIIFDVLAGRIVGLFSLENRSALKFEQYILIDYLKKSYFLNR